MRESAPAALPGRALSRTGRLTTASAAPFVVTGHCKQTESLSHGAIEPLDGNNERFRGGGSFVVLWEFWGHHTMALR